MGNYTIEILSGRIINNNTTKRELIVNVSTSFDKTKFIGKFALNNGNEFYSLISKINEIICYINSVTNKLSVIRVDNDRVEVNIDEYSVVLETISKDKMIVVIDIKHMEHSFDEYKDNFTKSFTLLCELKKFANKTIINNIVDLLSNLDEGYYEYIFEPSKNSVNVL